jgi:hypothetical protein
MATKRSSLPIADVELSVSRINRLLRPLRNKCAILASATTRPSSSTAPVTYGSSSLPQARAPPLLDVLQDPKLVILRAHQESRSLDALARQIYAVTGAYRNVVQAALPGGPDGSRQGFLALTDICAAKVGQCIRGEVARCSAMLEEPYESQETALVDELYESVPMRFRRWVPCSFCHRMSGRSSHYPTAGLLLRTRHPKSSAPAPINPCSCSVFLGWP